VIKRGNKKEMNIDRKWKWVIIALIIIIILLLVYFFILGGNLGSSESNIDLSNLPGAPDSAAQP